MQAVEQKQYKPLQHNPQDIAQLDKISQGSILNDQESLLVQQECIVNISKQIIEQTPDIQEKECRIIPTQDKEKANIVEINNQINLAEQLQNNTYQQPIQHIIQINDVNKEPQHQNIEQKNQNLLVPTQYAIQHQSYLYLQKNKQLHRLKMKTYEQQEQSNQSEKDKQQPTNLNLLAGQQVTKIQDQVQIVAKQLKIQQFQQNYQKQQNQQHLLSLQNTQENINNQNIHIKNQQSPQQIHLENQQSLEQIKVQQNNLVVQQNQIQNLDKAQSKIQQIKAQQYVQNINKSQQLCIQDNLIQINKLQQADRSQTQQHVIVDSSIKVIQRQVKLQQINERNEKSFRVNKRPRSSRQTSPIQILATNKARITPLQQKVHSVKSLKIVHNPQIHSLVMDIHLNAQKLKNLPQLRKNHYPQNKSAIVPNFKRLDHSITLQSNVINLVVGQIFQQHNKKDQIKNMLLEEIQQLKKKIQQIQANSYEQTEHLQSPNIQPSIYNDYTTSNINDYTTSNINNHTTSNINNQSQISKQSIIQQSIGESYNKQLKASTQFRLSKVQYKVKRAKHNLSQRSVKVQQQNTQHNTSFIKQYNTSNKSNKFIGYQDKQIKSQLKRKQGTLINKSIIQKDQIQKQIIQNNYISKSGQQSMPLRIDRQAKIGSIISRRNSISKKQYIDQSTIIINRTIQPSPQVNMFQTCDFDINQLRIKETSQIIEIVENSLAIIKFQKLELSQLKTNTKQQELVTLAHRIFINFGINIQNSNYLLNIKKYKNCVLFNLDSNKNIIWYYDNKVYFGSCDNSIKQGYGLEISITQQENQNSQQKINQSYQLNQINKQESENNKQVNTNKKISIYKGEFHKNKRNGKGIYKTISKTKTEQISAIYIGEWIKGLRTNYGIHMQLKNNCIQLSYEGTWLSNKKNGPGKLTLHQNTLFQTYEGTFLSGYKHGEGKETFMNNDFYQGNYQYNKFHGVGQYKWANGARYKGDFVKGIRHGYGKWANRYSLQINSKGLPFTQEHQPNSKQASNNVQQQFYDSYQGQYKNDKKNGFGIYRWKNGTIYKGQFLNDFKHGEGQIKYLDGLAITYTWNNGQIVNQLSIQQKNSQTAQFQKASENKISKDAFIDVKQKEYKGGLKFNVKRISLDRKV